jgi:TRAP-type C4-dicarboxylate transport system permease large subunit
LAETTKELWPFFGVAMILLIAVTYIPALTLY